MAGKMTDGTTNQWDMKTIAAYAEGCEARQNATNPTNPFVSGEPEYTAWAQGVTDIAAEDGTRDGCIANPDGAAAT